MKSYEEIRDSLNDLPITWYPALLIHILEICIDKKIFIMPFGLLNVVHKVINRKEV